MVVHVYLHVHSSEVCLHECALILNFAFFQHMCVFSPIIYYIIIIHLDHAKLYCHDGTLVYTFSVDVRESPFTVAENQLFEKCYTEGYDMTTDHKYNQWLQAHYPDATILAQIPQVSQGILVPFTAGITTFERSQQSVGRLSRFLQPPHLYQRSFLRAQRHPRVC